MVRRAIPCIAAAVATAALHDIEVFIDDGCTFSFVPNPERDQRRKKKNALLTFCDFMATHFLYPDKT